MILVSDIGKNVKRYRKARRLTQAQLAERTDISTVHLSHIETGSVSPSLECLLRFCEVLQITPNHLLLSDFQISQDKYLLQERMVSLTGDEQKFLIQVSELMQQLKMNR